jgi:phosphoribosylaminoimidazolecarboxamide formyltransferase/IMP cyclohydrolase
MAKVKLALLSVSDKQGIVEVGRRLAEQGLVLIASGGTEKALRMARLPVVAVSKLTGMGEFLDGRVKTLHPAVHGGILARRDQPAHMEALSQAGAAPIDVVVCNLYPFAETAARPGVQTDEVLEQIDIGGPAMVRAAAKNFRDVVVLVDPADYGPVLEAMEAGRLDEAMRRKLAHKAFAHVAQYDAAIAEWLAPAAAPAVAGVATVEVAEVPVQAAPHTDPAAGPVLADGDELLHLGDPAPLRYGENPHQSAWQWTDRGGSFVEAGGWRQLQGKPLSYNNLLDADAAWALLADLHGAQAAACVVKHGNPCGAAVMPTSIAGAVLRALDADPLSAYGGILAVNRPLDLAAVRALGDRFVEVILAPDFDPEAVELLAAKTNLRLLAMGDVRRGVRRELRASHFGLLVQEPDASSLDLQGATVATQVQPTPQQWAALGIAWRVAKHVKSNAIVIADESGTVGIGAGQMSRVDAATIAVGKCRKGYKPIAAASDAFFPFADGVEALVRAGVRAIVQPGGSKRDEEVIAAADAAQIAMVLSGERHFRH